MIRVYDPGSADPEYASNREILLRTTVYNSKNTKWYIEKIFTRKETLFMAPQINKNQ